jgi:hypothetical protein
MKTFLKFIFKMGLDTRNKLAYIGQALDGLTCFEIKKYIA